MNRFLFFGAALVLAGTSQAATLTFDFNNIVTSSGTPAGSAPWASAVFSDVGVDTVNMTLTNMASDPDEFLARLRLNVHASVAAVGASVLADPNGAFNAFSFLTDSFTDAGSDYDIDLDFKTSMGNRLLTGDFITVQFTGSGLDAMDFNSLSSRGEPQLALLHLQGIDGGGSAKLSPVPEPATALLAIALAPLLRRRKRV